MCNWYTSWPAEAPLETIKFILSPPATLRMRGPSFMATPKGWSPASCGRSELEMVAPHDESVAVVHGEDVHEGERRGVLVADGHLGGTPHE